MLDKLNQQIQGMEYVIPATLAPLCIKIFQDTYPEWHQVVVAYPDMLETIQYETEYEISYEEVEQTLYDVQRDHRYWLETTLGNSSSKTTADWLQIHDAQRDLTRWMEYLDDEENIGILVHLADYLEGLARIILNAYVAQSALEE